MGSQSYTIILLSEEVASLFQFAPTDKSVCGLMMGEPTYFLNLVSCLLTNKAKNKSECLSLMDDLSNEDCDEDMKYLTMCGNTLSGNISKQYFGRSSEYLLKATEFKFNKMTSKCNSIKHVEPMGPESTHLNWQKMSAYSGWMPLACSTVTRKVKMLPTSS